MDVIARALEIVVNPTDCVEGDAPEVYENLLH